MPRARTFCERFPQNPRCSGLGPNTGMLLGGGGGGGGGRGEATGGRDASIIGADKKEEGGIPPVVPPQSEKRNPEKSTQTEKGTTNEVGTDTREPVDVQSEQADRMAEPAQPRGDMMARGGGSEGSRVPREGGPVSVRGGIGSGPSGVQVETPAPIAQMDTANEDGMSLQRPIRGFRARTPGETNVMEEHMLGGRMSAQRLRMTGFKGRTFGGADGEIARGAIGRRAVVEKMPVGADDGLTDVARHNYRFSLAGQRAGAGVARGGSTNAISSGRFLGSETGTEMSSAVGGLGETTSAELGGVADATVMESAATAEFGVAELADVAFVL